MTARRALGASLALLVSFLLLAQVARADGPARMVVLFVDAHGQWERGAQERWEAAGKVTPPAGLVMVPFTQLLKGDFSSKLPAAQRDVVLRYPEMLLQTARRAAVFDARFVVIVRALKPDDGRATITVYDAQEGGRVILPEIKDRDLPRAVATLSKRLADGLTRLSSAVWGHVTAKVYHVTGCDHVREDQTIVIATEREAVRNGYEPCTICYTEEKDFRKRNGTEDNLGREVAAYIEKRYHLDTDPVRQARVDRVGRKLVDTNGLTGFNYTFRVLEVDEPNAFAAGGGHIYITRGLEKVTAGNDDMLAAVLGHEIGHTEEHHVLRQYRAQQTWAILGTIATVATGVYWPGLVTDFVGGMLGRGHGRVFELESDRLGVIYAYDAGYRPEDFILVINALKKLAAGHKTPDWLRTHPTEEKRLDRTRQLVAQLQGLDKVVASYQTIDPAVAAYIRRNGRFFVDRVQMLSETFPSWLAALGTAPAPVAGDEPPAAEASAPSQQGTDAQGVGSPSGSTRPVGDMQGTRVLPVPLDQPTKFTHD